MSEMNRLIKLHAERLQRVYDQRTAGDFTFEGALANFLIDVERARLDETIERIKATEKEQPATDLTQLRAQLAAMPSGTRCRCGDYFAESAKDLDEHVAQMMLVEDGKSHG